MTGMHGNNICNMIRRTNGVRNANNTFRVSFFTVTQPSLMDSLLTVEFAGPSTIGRPMLRDVQVCQINAVYSKEKIQSNALDARRSNLFQISIKIRNGLTVFILTVKNVS